jgi:hypothetical protein
MRCATNAWCASLPLVAGAVHTINEAQRLANQPSAADQIPTGYGGAIPLTNPAPTTTPGVAVTGNTSTAGTQLDQGTGPTTTGGSQIGAAAPSGNAQGGFGAGGMPVMNPLTMAVPTGDRNAITGGLNDVMGGLPTITNSGGTNQISEYPNGTRADADRVFDSLPLSNVRTTTSPSVDGSVRIGTLPDGTTVTVRPSRTGPPTIEIVDRNRPDGGKAVVQEIRFGSNL